MFRFFLLTLILTEPLWATTFQLEPIEVREQGTPTEFSERTGQWRYLETPNELFAADENRPPEDNLNYIPGVQARAGGSPTISIRGSAQAGRVLSLYNGIPLTSATGNGTPSLLIPQENIDRAFIFKGPASVLYGSSAMAGAVNFVPIRHERPTARVSVGSYASGDRLDKASTFLATPLAQTQKNPHALQATAFFQGDSGRFPYTLSTNGIRGTRSHNGSDLQRYTLSGEQTVRGYTLRQDLIIAHQQSHTPGSLYMPDQTYTQEWDTLGALSVEKSVDAANKLFFRTSGVFQDADYASENYGPSDMKAQQFQNSIIYTNQTAPELQTQVFLDWTHNRLQASYNNDRDLEENLYEVGVQFQTPSEGWTFQPGVRYIAAAEEVVTALGAFQQKQDRRWITYSEGFRMPSLSERHANFGTTAANPDLKPELSQSVEVGYLKTPEMASLFQRDGWSYGLTGFGTRYTNLIETENKNGLYRKVNRGDAKSVGAEALTGYTYAAWAVEGTAQLMKARIEKTGEEMRLAPKQQYSAAISCQMGPIVSELRHMYWSPYRDTKLSGEPVELGPRRTWDLNFRSVALSHWAFRAGIRNLFDAQMESTYGYPEAGREFYLSAQHYF